MYLIGKIARLGLLAFPLLIGAYACAEPANALDKPVAVVEDDLTHLLGCNWQKTQLIAACKNDALAGTISLNGNEENAEVVSIEINAIVVSHSKVAADQEKDSQAAVLKVVNYLFPDWKDGPSWFMKALSDARTTGGKDSIKRGAVQISVEWLQPADLDDTYAKITITK